MTGTALHFLAASPLWLLAAAGLAGLAMAFRGRRGGTYARLFALGLLLAALAGPRWMQERSTPLPDIVVGMIDDSARMGLGDRPKQAALAESGLAKAVKDLGNAELRLVHYRPADGGEGGTRLFEALNEALADLPRRRLAGVVLVTDGQIQDVPARLDLGAPLHVLLAGHRADRDRRLVIEQAPGFGMVGSGVTVTIRIEDPGHDGAVAVSLRQDGGAARIMTLPANRSLRLTLPVVHGGSNVFELAVEAAPDELTAENNRAVLAINGVRDRLRVLLISGEPHAGERVWRNLLKADPSVDLVHFTILRPPEKDDHTPTRSLALIPFPVQELFADKLKSFDLVILDRFQRRNLLAPAYYGNLVAYVKGGGALLLSVGPEFIGPDSPFDSALASVIPAAPGGGLLENFFRPVLTETGRRHPVTAGLEGGASDPPGWGPWARLERVVPAAGAQILMNGPQGAPLLVLDHVGEGRVALLASDTAWLWSKGWQGGGPQAELLRRLAHWLMKEPELEEERLSAQIAGDRLKVERRSLSAGDGEATVTAPDGRESRLALADQHDGRAIGQKIIDQPGLWHVADGSQRALAAAGALDPVEMAEVRATPVKLAPLVAATGGGIAWIEDKLPRFIAVGAEERAAGTDWLGLRRRDVRQLSGLADIPLLPDGVFLVLALLALGLAWWREGRR